MPLTIRDLSKDDADVMLIMKQTGIGTAAKAIEKVVAEFPLLNGRLEDIQKKLEFREQELKAMRRRLAKYFAAKNVMEEMMNDLSMEADTIEEKYVIAKDDCVFDDDDDEDY